MIRPGVAALLALGAACAAACAPQHIRPHTPRARAYQPGSYEEAPEAVSDGSLWQEASVSLFADFRARAVGDIVVVTVDESPHATGDASTEMERDQQIQLGIPNLLGMTAALQRAYPGLDPSKLIDLVSSRSFRGDGETQRASRVRGQIAVRVRRVMPNGDLFVEGTKVLLVNEEELHIYLSGVVRPQDIQEDNSVGSSRIADAQVEFTGRGSLTDNQRQGWLARLISALTPF